jgi:hypothetical protein
MNPYAILAAALLLGLTAWQSYEFGHRNARNECGANAGAAASATESAEDRRDENIDGIGQSARDRAAAAEADTKEAAYAGAEVIRTVVVPGPCRAVPAAVVQEHAGAVDRINAKVRSGLRPGASLDPAASADDGAREVRVGADPARPVRMGNR